MNELKIKKKDSIERSIKPFHEYYDGTTTPFGKKGIDEEFRILHDTTSRYGYNVHPIWAVVIFNENGYKEYKIFVGEAPHKNEEGVWVTYNKVPTFVISSFAGAHFIDKEPDIPHIINIETDEFREQEYKKHDEDGNKMYHEKYKIEMELYYCTFKTYFKGLCNRFTRRFGTISKYDGKRVKQIRYSLPYKEYYLTFAKDKEYDSIYLWQDTDKWWKFLYFKKDGKWCLKYNKEENTHEYTGC